MIYEIAMRPFPKARPRVTLAGTYMPREYQEKRKELRLLIRAQHQGAIQPIAANVELICEFDMKGRRTADLDNLAGGLMDSITELLILDDRQVRALTAKVNIGAKEDRITFRITPLDANPSPYRPLIRPRG